MKHVGSSQSAAATPQLAELLHRHHDDAIRFVQHEAGVVLLRFDTPEDLVQGAFCRALECYEQFEYQGDAAFRGWLKQVLRHHVIDRRDYWFAMKRNRGRLLRLTWQGVGASSAHPLDLAGSDTGPSSFAARREHLQFITRATGLLLGRDQDLVRWTAQGVTLQDVAQRLGITENAAGRARTRAMVRLKKIFLMLVKQGSLT